MNGIKSDIKFTVIIPTRERCDTLKWALKTCTTQNYENFEVIVSDNHSQDATCEVVESCQDNRIRYVNTGERMSMSHNWEFGLSHATGDYVAFVGDDDGLMPNALNYASELISKTQTDALICKKPLYYWTNHLIPEYKNILALSLRDSVKKINSQKLLNEITRFEGIGAPLIYDGFVKKDVLDEIKNMSGRFFNSQIPDIYSAVAILGVVPDYCYSSKPFLIQGISSHSTGASYLVQGGASKAAVQFYEEENIPFHPKMLSSPSMYILIAESLLQAKEFVSTSLSYDFDIKLLVNKAMQEATSMSPHKYELVVESVKHIGESFEIQDYVANAIKEHPNVPSESLPFQRGYNFMKDTLVVNLNEDKVNDIYHASLECEKIRNNASSVFYLKHSAKYVSDTIRKGGVITKIQQEFSRFISSKTS